MAGDDNQDQSARNVAAVILAGGRGSRFGGPKAAARFLGRPMLDWVVTAASAVTREVVVVAAPEEMPALPPLSTPVRVVRDPKAFAGPLAGAATGFAAIEAETAFLLSCDAPLLRDALLAGLLPYLADHDALIPVVAGRRQPLTALYRVRPVLNAFQADLDTGERSLVRALEGLDVVTIDEDALRSLDPHLLSFRGINTPGDMASLEEEARQFGIAAPG